MDHMGMEPAGAWGPSSEFQLTNWTVEEPAAAGLPLEYASDDIFGTCSRLQAYVPESIGGQQLVQYNYCRDEAVIVVDGQNHQEVVDPHKLETRNVISNSRDVFVEVEGGFKIHIEHIQEMMHRYPPAFQDAIYKSYTTPRIVSIGPYHHHHPHLKQAEKVKHMAVIIILKESKYQLLEEIYEKVAAAAENARHLYDKNTIEDISPVDFRNLMFVDACFLVHFMRMDCNISKDKSLDVFLGPYSREVYHDLILLENQLPWIVVEEVLNLMPDEEDLPLGKFISYWKHYMQHHKPEPEKREVAGDVTSPWPCTINSTLVEHEKYKPHLLGLLRYYTVGEYQEEPKKPKKEKSKKPKKHKGRSISFSVIELAEIGISLKADKTMKLKDMRVNEGTLLAELSLPPLSLDLNRASFLLNMAALELCAVKSFSKAPVEDSAVCSYLQLLALLVCREEDVQELRVRGLLQGGGGLTDEESFRFLTSFQGLRFGRCYNRVLDEIEEYKENRWKEAKIYSFYYKHKRTIAAIVTGVGALVGIIGTLVSIKTSL